MQLQAGEAVQEQATSLVPGSPGPGGRWPGPGGRHEWLPLEWAALLAQQRLRVEAEIVGHELVEPGEPPVQVGLVQEPPVEQRQGDLPVK